MPRVIKFDNGVFPVREDSIIEFHATNEDYRMRVDRFEKEFIVIKDFGTAHGRVKGEGEIWNLPCHLSHETFIKY